MSWQDFYLAAGGDFGILPNSRFYGPRGHRGKDYQHDAGTPIPAYEHGTIVNIEHSSFIGWCVVVRLDDGRFAGWAHVTNAPLGLGAEVQPGTTIGHVAGADDDPGSSWAGAHSHTTLGPSADSIFQGVVEDPVPRIDAAIGGIHPAFLEDDMYTQQDRTRDENIYAGLYKGASVQIDGRTQKFNYGILPIVAHNQTLIREQSGRIAELEAMVAQLVSAHDVELDMDAVNRAGEEGRRTAENDLPVSEELDNIEGIDVQNL